VGDELDIARDVLIEAFGASATPFVPVPFVDDWMFARLLRRISTKVLARHGIDSPVLARAVVDAYVKAGSPPLAKSILMGAVRFVVRKVAVVLDVKKSHDVFGESIAFAVALDIAVQHGWAHEDADVLGGAMQRAVAMTPSGVLEALVRAVRAAFGEGGGPIGGAISAEVEKLREQLAPTLAQEMLAG
jgi:hypothetical protein